MLRCKVSTRKFAILQICRLTTPQTAVGVTQNVNTSAWSTVKITGSKKVTTRYFFIDYTKKRFNISFIKERLAMKKTDIVREFVAIYRPQELLPDTVAIQTCFSQFVDSLHRDGRISDKQAHKACLKIIKGRLGARFSVG